ncbi:hypothetical protein Vafri_10309 [Volvox africanus]|uniref:Uncharacterized protein n=1 Tax=Volvox africanus TaxID=51714 RepID=A0A8J4F248_9CHLO|nr:hypothetical protein Vafri_10309 [Volvox africanus]
MLGQIVKAALPLPRLQPPPPPGFRWLRACTWYGRGCAAWCCSPGPLLVPSTATKQAPAPPGRHHDAAPPRGATANPTATSTVQPLSGVRARTAVPDISLLQVLSGGCVRGWRGGSGVPPHAGWILPARCPMRHGAPGACRCPCHGPWLRSASPDGICWGAVGLRSSCGGRSCCDDAEVSHANREAPAASTVSDAATAAAGPGAAADRGSDVGDGPPDAVVWLCEMVLEEVVRLSSPGRSSLDTSEGRVRAYAAELFKTPMRLLPGLPVINAATSPAVLTTIRWLAYLGRRAMLKASGGNLVKTVVPDTAYKKLQEFVRMLESLQQVKTAPISEEDAKVFLQAFREQHREKLEQLPSFEDVTADLAPDDEWDVLLAVDTSQGGVGARTAGGRADQARAKKRGPGTKGAKCGATKSHGSTMTTTMATRTRQTGKAAASRGTTSSRRADACDTTDTDDGFDADQGCGGAGMDMNTDIESDDDVFRRENTAAATKGTRNRAGGAAATATATARPAASQDTSAASYVGTQPERRSSRAAAAKASEKLEALRLN